MLREVAGQEVVDADDLVPLGEQAVAEVAAEEAGAAGDDDSSCGASPSVPVDWRPTQAYVQPAARISFGS